MVDACKKVAATGLAVETRTSPRDRDEKGRKGPAPTKKGLRLVIRRQVPGTVDARPLPSPEERRAIIMYTINANTGR